MSEERRNKENHINFLRLKKSSKTVKKSNERNGISSENSIRGKSKGHKNPSANIQEQIIITNEKENQHPAADSNKKDYDRDQMPTIIITSESDDRYQEPPTVIDSTKHKTTEDVSDSGIHISNDHQPHEPVTHPKPQEEKEEEKQCSETSPVKGDSPDIDTQTSRKYRTYYNSNFPNLQQQYINKEQCYTLNGETEDGRQTPADNHYDESGPNYIYNNEKEWENRYFESKRNANDHTATALRNGVQEVPYQNPNQQSIHRQRLNNPNNNVDEKYEISRKKNNIVIQGLEEQGIENDTIHVINLNKAIGNDDFGRYNILRIGRIGEERGGKNRPLKVELDSYVTKLDVMRNANKLQFSDQYWNISIQHDLTRKQTIIFSIFLFILITPIISDYAVSLWYKSL